MRAKSYELLRRAAEEGALLGVRRARKHVDAPTDEAVADAVADAVMTAICEVFSFADEEAP